ncbi:hypothetical protein M9434_000615 [Picochlorum sp. BPE23]|nr:hypothetical protein M9434_000615 [Picochlorum sp. BPE23]
MEAFRSCLRHSRKLALVSQAQECQYMDVVSQALRVRYGLIEETSTLNRDCFHPDSKHLGGCAEQPRVAIMASRGTNFVSGMFASWMIQGIAVPLCPSHPDHEIEYLLRDSDPSVILCDDAHAERMKHVGATLSIPVHPVLSGRADSLSADTLLEQSIQGIQEVDEQDGALMLYTSGTTGRPKGVVHTHGSLSAQMHSIAKAWEMRPSDRVLHCLPLHHVHGVVNALLTPLFVGGTVEVLPKFSVTDVLQTLERGGVSIFMGVPTMYSFLAKGMDESYNVKNLQRLRAWICGSAACPLPLLQTWKHMVGSYPLERYGMTETGMILGNPLQEDLRKPGTVGLPFPGMEVDLRNDGELFCRGRQLFRGYWGLPEVTLTSFDHDGWFCTGDTAEEDGDGYISLLGRTSSDIIKSGGYKISALHVESALLEHPSVDEACVFGVQDADYGEKIVALLCGLPDSLTDSDLLTWCGGRLAPYQVPTRFLRLDHLPRNAMGKVNKRALKEKLMHDISQ